MCYDMEFICSRRIVLSDTIYYVVYLVCMDVFIFF